MTEKTTFCSTCHTDRPGGGNFCPFCGAKFDAAPRVNSRFIRAFTPTAEIELGDEFLARRRRKRWLGAAVGVATAGAVVAGLFVGAWLIETAPQRNIASPAPATVAAAPSKVAPGVVPLLIVRDVPGGFDIVAGDEVMHSIRTADQSRYPTLAERKRAVQVRLDHVTEKTDGRFEARAAGTHYEVVWSDGASSFRLFDVTRADVDALGTEHVDISANLAADRMNAATKRPVAPVSAVAKPASSPSPA